MRKLVLIAICGLVALPLEGLAQKKRSCALEEKLAASEFDKNIKLYGRYVADHFEYKISLESNNAQFNFGGGRSDSAIIDTAMMARSAEGEDKKELEAQNKLLRDTLANLNGVLTTAINESKSLFEEYRGIAGTAEEKYYTRLKVACPKKEQKKKKKLFDKFTDELTCTVAAPSAATLRAQLEENILPVSDFIQNRDTNQRNAVADLTKQKNSLLQELAFLEGRKASEDDIKEVKKSLSRVTKLLEGINPYFDAMIGELKVEEQRRERVYDDFEAAWGPEIARCEKILGK